MMNWKGKGMRRIDEMIISMETVEDYEELLSYAKKENLLDYTLKMLYEYGQIHWYNILYKYIHESR